LLLSSAHKRSSYFLRQSQDSFFSIDKVKTPQA
jgi:hypothetical protein